MYKKSSIENLRLTTEELDDVMGGSNYSTSLATDTNVLVFTEGVVATDVLGLAEGVITVVIAEP